MLGMMQAPEANVRKVLPPDFSTASLVPLTSMVLFEALHCDRIVVGNKVVQDVYSFYVTLAVVLKNETWGTEGRSFFEFERYFSSEEVASFYRGLGIPAETATFDVDVLPVLSDKGMTWAVTHGSSKFSFEYPIVKPDDSNDSLTIYTWTGSNPYLQINHEMSKTFDGNLPAGVLRLEGSSKTSELLGAPVGPWVGNMYPSFNEVIFVEPTLFVGGST